MKKLLLILFAFHFSLFILNAQIITTIAGNGIAGSSGDGGPASAAELYNPVGLYIYKGGDIYIADSRNNKIRMINSSGIITTIAGNGIAGISGDGGPAITAELNGPTGMCKDALGNLYIADQKNNEIRKVDISGKISTIAGNGIMGFSGDGGAATSCKFSLPTSICLDTNGNLYIADDLNYRIRKINTSGIIYTVVGGGPNSVTDGVPATSVRLGETSFLAVNDSGNIYVSTTVEPQIYRVDGVGNIYIVAGTRTIGYSGDGGPATDAEMYQVGICLDSLNNLYIADGANNRVREVNHSTGIINTIVGNGIGGYNGDGIFAIDAELAAPEDVFKNSYNDLYIADYNNNRIRKVTGITGIEQNKNPLNASLFPNPNNGQFTVQSSVVSGQYSVEVYNVLGEKVYSASLPQTPIGALINLSNQPNGIYLYRLIGSSGELLGEGKMVIQK